MTPATVLPLLANHLWQSTVFVLAAGLLTLALRKKQARTRYWIWWVASLKFLIPFSLLVSLGSLFSWRAAPQESTEAPTSTIVGTALLAAAAIAALAGPILVGVVQAKSRGAQLYARSVAPRVTIPAREPFPIPQAQVPQQAPRVPAQGLTATRWTFDVISIRPNTGAPAGGGTRGGPGQRGGGGGGPAAACGGIVQVNPGRLVATNVTLYRLITLAYGKHCRLSTEQDLVSGGPDWRESTAFDIQATLPPGAPSYTQQQLQNGEAPELQMMIQNLLAERFSLSLHRTSKEIPVFNLVLVKMGRIKLSEDQTPPPPLLPPTGPPTFRDANEPPPPPPRGSFGVGVSPAQGTVTIFASAIPVSQIINFIQGGVGRMVVDKVEPRGLFDIPQVELNVGPFEVAPGAVTVWPEIMLQLGLKLEPTRGPAEVLGIDRAEKPTEN